jgi:phosphoglycolate phosphatase
MKKMRAGLIIFDLDGTLIDSSSDIATHANKTLRNMGRKGLPAPEIKAAIGWGVKMLFQGLMKGEGPERIEEARRIFLDLYGKRPVIKTRAYPGVASTLKYFRQMEKKMAVVTNKPVALAERILEDLGLAVYFDVIFGGDSFENRKPHPEPIERAMRALGVPPQATVIVGDSPVDCESGKKAGIATIGVSYGFRGSKELLDADCGIIIDDFPCLKKILI